jgi:hypothetical protein
MSIYMAPISEDSNGLVQKSISISSTARSFKSVCKTVVKGYDDGV